MSRYDSLTPPQKGEFFKFPDGESQVRFVSEPFDMIRHFIQAEQRSYTCPGEENGCRFCADGDEPNTKFIYRIIDRADGKVKLAEVGWSIVGAMKEFHDSKEYGFDTVPSYDVFVTKTGKALQTKYAVLPARKDSPLTEEEKGEIAGAKSIEDFIESKKEDAQYVERLPTEEGREKLREEIARTGKRQAEKPPSPLDTFNRIKADIAAAGSVKEVEDVLGMAIFEKDINDTMDRMLKGYGDARKKEIEAGL